MYICSCNNRYQNTFHENNEDSTVETITEQAKEAFQLENISLVQSNGHHF